MSVKTTAKNATQKSSLLPHSQAKLNLFKGYLENYLRVLIQADFCKKINLFDIYCGEGLYDDGKKGSPLLAIDCIKNVRTEMLNDKNSIKPISLCVNDFDNQKIEKVKNNIDTNGLKNFTIEYHNKDADKMLDIVASQVSKCPKDHRNLVFIDPYGYSEINKDKLISLLNNKCTEIILFLPVMQMYRFSEPAFNYEDKSQYEKLRNFINSFSNYSEIKKSENIFKYIHFIKNALSINNTYFTCSHYIEREKGFYYALFFIGSHIFGLEKMLDTKWKLDPVKGKGFNQNKNPNQLSMFDEQMNEIDNLREISYLENVIYQIIKQKDATTNIEIYESTLRNEFLPKHANIVLKKLDYTK